MGTINATSSTTSTAKVVVPANVWRKNIIRALSNLMLIFDPAEARRALKCPNLMDWSWKGRSLYPHAAAKRDDLIKQLSKVAQRKEDMGFSIFDLEYFVKYYSNLKKDNLTAVAEMEAEFNAGTSPLSAIDLAKSRIDMHFDRSCMTTLIDILNTEIGHRHEAAKKAREEFEATRTAREEANRKRAEELRAQEAEAEAKRQEYLRNKMEEAKAKRNMKYVPPVKRSDFTTTVSNFADLAIVNRKSGKFMTFEAVPKAKAIEIAGVDVRTFESAYKTAKASSQDTILTLADYRQIGYKKNGAAVQYVVRS